MFLKSPKPDSRLNRYDHIIVHCTATPPTMVLVNAAWVDKAHKERGWNGCGYHAVITRAGDWQDNDSGFPARPIGQQGAHVGDCGPGWNSRSFGISLAGGIDVSGKPENNYTEEQLAVLKIGIERFLAFHPSPQKVRIIGHRDLIAETKAPPKACPCFDVVDWLAYTKLKATPPAKATGGILRTIHNMIEKREDVKSGGTKMLLPHTHTIVEGDTLWKLSQLYGVSLAQLRKLNPGVVNDVVIVGKRIVVTKQ